GPAERGRVGPREHGRARAAGEWIAGRGERTRTGHDRLGSTASRGGREANRPESQQFRSLIMSRTTILLADDHVLFIEGLVGLLKDRFAIVGAVHDGLKLLEEAHRLRPQVIISDLSMPQLGGLEAVRRLSAQLPEIRVVLLTMHADPILGAEALRS